MTSTKLPDLLFDRIRRLERRRASYLAGEGFLGGLDTPG
jgi:hypothetical protein